MTFQGGQCGECDEPEGDDGRQAILHCNPGHSYGSCGVDGYGR